MAEWICGKCGNEVYTRGDEPPTPLHWSDHHKCHMIRLDTLTPEHQKMLIAKIEESL